MFTNQFPSPVTGIRRVGAVLKAVLPALIFAEVATDAIASFVVRSVGKQAVMTIGTAANDASFVSGFMSWLGLGTAIGSVVVVGKDSSGAPKTYEVSVASAGQNDLTKGPMIAKWTAPSSEHAMNIPAFPAPMDDPAAAVAIIIASWNAVYAHQYYGHDMYVGCYNDAVLAGSGANATYTVPIVFVGNACTAANYSWGSWDVSLNAVQVEQPDGIRRIRGSVGSWSADTSDPDWTSGEAAKIVNAKALRFAGQTADGKLQVLDLASNNSSLNLQFQEQAAFDQLRAFDLLTTTGLIPYAVDSTTQPGQVSQTPLTTDVAGSSSAGSGQQSITFPTDYARQGEASAAAGTITPKLDTLHNDLSTQAEVPDPVLDTSEFQTAFFHDTFTGLLAWRLPAHSSVCPTVTFSLAPVLAGSYVMDSQCTVLGQVSGGISAAFIVLWLLVALFVVLKA